MDRGGTETGNVSGSTRERALDRECALFCRYLIGESPDPYVIEWYGRAHTSRPDLFTPASGAEAPLLAVAHRGRAWTRMADAFSRVVLPGSILRRKLALLSAILECSPTTFEAFETPVVRSIWSWWFSAAMTGVKFATTLIAGMVLLGPRHLVRRRAQEREGRSSTAGGET